MSMSYGLRDQAVDAMRAAKAQIVKVEDGRFVAVVAAIIIALAVFGWWAGEMDQEGGTYTSAVGETLVGSPAVYAGYSSDVIWIDDGGQGYSARQYHYSPGMTFSTNHRTYTSVYIDKNGNALQYHWDGQVGFF